MLWNDACFKWLGYTLPLSEDGLTSPVPLTRPTQTKLVRGAGTKQNPETQTRISQEEPQKVGTHTDFLSDGIHVRDIVHLYSSLVWTSVSLKEKTEKTHTSVTLEEHTSEEQYYIISKN